MRKAKYILISSFISLCVIIGLSQVVESRTIEIQYSDLTRDAKTQVDCLAENIYHEAGHEPKTGKQAVAQVTLNRVLDPRFPKDICGVVKQKTKIDIIGDKRVACQFSWFCMPVILKKNTQAYQESLDVALFVYANYEKLKDITDGALYYHADYVNPRWRGVEKTTIIGRHIFYKEKGRDL